ncbi:MAG: BMP family ABC transporter substrate-binding protein [Acetatifactor sp.]|nr:BMP family ABC transporter substrate-binding protein [Acetatifactor sp.]
MRNKVRVFAALALGLCLLAGCGSKTPDDYATNKGYAGENRADSAAKEEGNTEIDGNTGIAKEDIKVGVLYITDPGEGSGYSYTHDLGIIGMQNNLGLTDAQIVRDIVDDEDSEATRASIEKLVADGCNVIFTTSWGYMQTTADMAEEYPDVYFSHGTGYLSNGRNFNNYFGRIYQPRYLSGIVAGMNTSSNMIGYVAAQDVSNSEVTGGIDAFALGVAAVNPDAKVYVVVTNSWYAPDKEEAASRKLLDMGCDVMAQHCDTPYPQTLAQEYGVYGVGYNSDMSKETPDSCLCSVVWNWSAYYTAAVSSVINGTWDGSNYYGGMVEGVVNLTDTAAFAAEGTAERVAEATADILRGTFNIFDGELKTNTGETVGVAGGTLDDATITGGINWYYENVVVVE